MKYIELIFFGFCFSTQNRYKTKRNLYLTEEYNECISLDKQQKTSFSGMTYNEAVDTLLTFKTEDDFRTISTLIRNSLIFRGLEERNKEYAKYCESMFSNFDEVSQTVKIYKILKLNFVKIFYNLFNGNTDFKLSKFFLRTLSIKTTDVNVDTMPYLLLLNSIHRMSILCLCENYLFERFNKNAIQIYSPNLGIPLFAGARFYYYLNRVDDRTGKDFISKNSQFYQELRLILNGVEKYSFAFELITFELTHIFYVLTNSLEMSRSRLCGDFERENYSKDKINSLFFNLTIREDMNRAQETNGLFYILFAPHVTNCSDRRISQICGIDTFLKSKYRKITKQNISIPKRFKDCESIKIDTLKDLKMRKIRFTELIMFDFFMTILQLYSENFSSYILVDILQKNEFIDIQVSYLGEHPPYDSILNKYKEENDITQEVRDELDEKHKSGAEPKFTPIIDFTKEYYFKRPDNFIGDAVVSKCLKLSCGHYIGEENIEEWFKNDMEKCQYCNKHVFIVGYFEHETYLIE
ncbi:hypothetical protein NGRA_0850 [Nosema granulosis]|uniref:Uncharacterized protein n=1 Tax=Nosema granulosis TaxID=83296 RepID=A0A9P6H2A5_9MICR|nr:hypothetical protein NGRA_0850 [Nosema granulosis]